MSVSEAGKRGHPFSCGGLDAIHGISDMYAPNHKLNMYRVYMFTFVYISMELYIYVKLVYIYIYILILRW